jgi:septal ring factor EnvC (AmiA/AmiB activator)
MPRTSVMQRSSASLKHVSRYPKDLLDQLQATLAALADVEARYEREREHLKAGIEPETNTTQRLAELESRRRREREPCVQRLAELHRRMMATTVYRDLYGTT